MAIFDIKVDYKELAKLEHKLTDPKLQEIFSYEVMRHSDKYVPFASGVLKNSAFVDTDKKGIVYVAPYARYHWYGKLMVDQITQKGAFYSPDYGFWSRPMTPKELTDIDMQYSGAPIRGSHWVERMWISEGKEITEAILKRMTGDNK